MDDDKRGAELDNHIASPLIATYGGVLALYECMTTWKTRWTRVTSEYEWEQLLCAGDYLTQIQDLAKRMQYAVDEVLDASPHLLDSPNQAETLFEFDRPDGAR